MINISCSQWIDTSVSEVQAPGSHHTCFTFSGGLTKSLACVCLCGIQLFRFPLWMLKTGWQTIVSSTITFPIKNILFAQFALVNKCGIHLDNKYCICMNQRIEYSLTDFIDTLHLSVRNKDDDDESGKQFVELFAGGVVNQSRVEPIHLMPV